MFKLFNWLLIKRQTSGTSCDKEWQRMVQREKTNDNEWQRMTTSGTTSDNPKENSLNLKGDLEEKSRILD